MKKIIASGAGLMLGLQLAFANPPAMNLGVLKQEIVQYHQSGEYDQDISKVIAEAQNYLQERVARNKQLKPPEKLAIVLDIDETSLSNYANLKRLDFGGTSQEIDQAFSINNDPAIKPTLDLYNYARQHHVAVFFVTGRTEENRQETIANLKQAGFSHWNHLYMKPNDYHEKSAIPYKTAMRRQIEKMGYDIVLNIGDQWSDLRGGHAEKAYKLPDYMYYIS